MPIIKIKNKDKAEKNEVILKCEKVSEKVAYKMNLSDLPEKILLIVDIGERRSSFTMEGFFVDEGDKPAYQSKNETKEALLSWDGSDDIIMFNKNENPNEEEGKAISGVVTNFTAAYIEGENYFKFTLEFVEKLAKEKSEQS